ncbi:MAG: hypothetical protein KatS3mg105_1364 [Gemmatales bacterium]|nr:MAG: hypothetical protein KatS3mg105_1364 [Gemmatales bacterium]
MLATFQTPTAQRGSVVSDAALLEAARSALQNSGYRAVAKLRCEVKNGVVTVSGLVPCYYLKQIAQAVIQRLEDVAGVRNLVVVRSPAYS